MRLLLRSLTHHSRQFSRQALLSQHAFIPMKPQTETRLAKSIRYFSAAPSRHQQQNTGSNAEINIEPKLQMTFTCTAQDCNGHRSTHTFTKRAYRSGIVLLTCPHCKNRHLIADNLGWFKESTQEGKLKNVEDLLNARGEQVKRGRVGNDGVLEFYGENMDTT